ncbi:peptidoglycan editing factor PgeF [Marinobacter mobilis]|uniref:Purine nucleoside phosphorylase n=1 Tax=Marinobacter mobilis TaxID=488533 RepID=A0A1H3B7Y7_9GAMM|nr:peptidoglycan editing factor PgeF [Marinobacter mobilis]SDX37524.1 conserved hypothetical protein [Marinobacter mobilis]
MTSELPVITPDWPAPRQVHAGCSTRLGGTSVACWHSLNLGGHVSDNPGYVAENRQRLAEWAGVSGEAFCWLEQVHGTVVVDAPSRDRTPPRADASVTRDRGVVCTVLTADCLPVLFCARDGRQVGAAHAGWRGLCAGVLENTLSSFRCSPSEIMVWLGPAIGPQAFEVGAEVRQQFLAEDAGAGAAFVPSPQHPDRYLANLYLLARQRLISAGVTDIYGGDFCTYSDPERFYSYRRDGVTGRMASFIWLD